MRVLYLHPNEHCYLAESLFHGLRSLLGADCVEVPHYRSLYAPLTDDVRNHLRGGGFTLYGLLPELPELEARRRAWREELKTYDLVILARIWDQGLLFQELSRLLGPDRLVLVDGADSPTVFPFGWKTGGLNHHPSVYFSPVSRYRYFKREWIDKGASYGRLAALRWLHPWLPGPRYMRPIAFSIPAEKIVRVSPHKKSKEFPAHIVDADVAATQDGAVYSGVGSSHYAFTTEADYVRDLQQSRFGVTTKRAGWDCLRHYELAANGCVLAFRDVDQKPETCAPHGLNASNSLSYRSVQELQQKIAALSPSEYERLQKASYDWIEQNTTLARARQFVKECQTPLV